MSKDKITKEFQKNLPRPRIIIQSRRLIGLKPIDNDDSNHDEQNADDTEVRSAVDDANDEGRSRVLEYWYSREAAAAAKTLTTSSNTQPAFSDDKIGASATLLTDSTQASHLTADKEKPEEKKKPDHDYIRKAAAAARTLSANNLSGVSVVNNTHPTVSEEKTGISPCQQTELMQERHSTIENNVPENDKPSPATHSKRCTSQV